MKETGISTMEIRKMSVLSVICLIGYILQGVESQQGLIPQPCQLGGSTVLYKLNERRHDFEGPASVGDYYLEEGWYSMGTYVISSIDADCGTVHPWHLDGNLPDGMTEASMKVCDKSCTVKKPVTVQKCADGTYRFKLVPLDSSSEGYCIEKQGGQKTDLTAPKLNFAKPTISAEVLRINGNNNLHFYCDFTPDDDTLLYTVEWAETSGLTGYKPITKVESVRFDQAFKLRTALNEDGLKLRNLGLGITIMCSVTAKKDVAGLTSNTIESNRKFCGIEVLDKELINLNTNDDVTVRIRLTVPFGCHKAMKKCTLNVGIFFPKTVNTCELPTIKVTKSKRGKCGVTIYSDKYDEIQTFSLKRIGGGLMGKMNRMFVLRFRTEKRRPDHSLFENYFLKEIRVNVQADTTKINGKTCYSHNDPHMKTFAGRPYENQKPGKYVFYKHNKYEVEVQLWTSQMPGVPTVSLNCGIAIRAGKDVFVYSICEGRKEINFRICEDAVLHRQVKQKGKNYEVYLPTGTVVVIHQYSNNAVNFDLRAGVMDADSTDGLCGSLDNPGLVPNPAQYVVNPVNDLFNIQTYQRLKHWSEKEYLCNCEAGADFTPNNELESAAVCDAQSQTFCKDDGAKVTNLDRVCALARRKRHASLNNFEDAFGYKDYTPFYWTDTYTDTYSDTSSTFLGETPFNDGLQIKRHLSKRMVYDDVSARRDCMAILNTTAFQKCSNLPHLDVEPYIKDCIMDAKLTHSMDWASTHLESIKDQCVHQVKVNQPLSEEAKAELNRGFENVTDVEVEQVLPTPSPVFTKEILQEVSDLNCPNDCSSHGRCEKGECVCNAGYMDVDCSVDSNQPPKMSGISNHGLCDKQRKPCDQATVFGDNFVDSSTLTCRISSFTINQMSETSISNSVDVPAESMSISEVICQLPGLRRRREIMSQTSNDVVAIGYNISISNNGRVFSAADTVVVFDSRCVNCSKHGGQAFCNTLPGYCVRRGACYAEGEERDCTTCSKDSDGELQLTQSKAGNCTASSDSTTTFPSQAAHLWMIIAVVTLTACFAR